jgi:hypothetical protein
MTRKTVCAPGSRRPTAKQFSKGMDLLNGKGRKGPDGPLASASSRDDHHRRSCNRFAGRSLSLLNRNDRTSEAPSAMARRRTSMFQWRSRHQERDAFLPSEVRITTWCAPTTPRQDFEAQATGDGAGPRGHAGKPPRQTMGQASASLRIYLLMATPRFISISTPFPAAQPKGFGYPPTARGLRDDPGTQ